MVVGSDGGGVEKVAEGAGRAEGQPGAGALNNFSMAIGQEL